MLEGIRANEIIVGAYTDEGGICPMLAAHRAGGRTSQISFARAWDRFAFRGVRVGAARRATERELLVLRTHLEASLLEEDAPAGELVRAMAEHRALIERRALVERRVLVERRSEPPAPSRPQTERRPRPGDRDRTKELRRREGWAWLRVFRRYDEYERALERLRTEQERVMEREPVPSG
jgi:hypothetical protein